MATRAEPIQEPTTRSAEAGVGLLGVGLLIWGLGRGTWTGLALAAAGTLLLVRALAEPRRAVPEPESAEELDFAQQEGPDEDEGLCIPPPSALGDVVTDAGLTDDEHAAARVGAYFRALERGGGRLPGYDPERAVEDFCRAAADVVRRREDLQPIPTPTNGAGLLRNAGRGSMRMRSPRSRTRLSP